MIHSSVPSTAEEWVARLRASDVTPEERAAFEAWLKADADHRTDYARCRELEAMPALLRDQPDLMCGLAARLEALRSSPPSLTASPPLPWERAGERVRLTRPLRAAAAIALAAFGLLFALRAPPPLDPATLSAASTRHGEQRPIALADGSTIQLNTDTAITWRMAGNERRVILERGEAFFDVAKDATRPFVVEVGKSEVRVVGTQFSVRRQTEQVEVVVKEGRVNIVPDTGPLGVIAAKVELTRGNQAQMESGSHQVAVASVDADRLTAWRTGSLEFDGMTLDEVVTEVNRYTDTRLVIGDDTLKSQRISGRVRVGDIETIRFILRERFDIESVERDGVIRLSRREGS